ncbi:uncharacterized protein Tco025E_00620 [Trypanosoma conorhini]|uniref:Uncharacterized protein n=1 Tax=Trypanosoma conorhini TaxID=83891 RepID=A0A3S5IUP4_9TRYP|nr:uncharacterized protein Tco025E_00620 [Trypanosoma conorhini]RNF27122.1 hypothetical protein Tco025E_00620 [Trypanosoma conorhini]
MTHPSEDELQAPRKTGLTPPLQGETQVSSAGESALSGALEGLLSVSYLRQHAQEVYDAATSDPASPASLLAAMDDSLTVPLSYLLRLPAVRDAVPSGLNNERTANLFAAATRRSEKIVLRSTLKELRVGPFPQAFSRSRCTLHVQGVSSTLTLSDVQAVIPRHPIFHFYRLSQDTVNVTFENARSAKEAFVLLQGRTFGGCNAVQVKMRMESEKHPQLLSQRRTSRMGATSAASTATNANATATNSVSPVVPIDAFLPFSKTEEDSFAWSPWKKPHKCELLPQPYSSLPQQQQQHADMHPPAGRRRMLNNDPMKGVIPEYAPSNMNFMTMPRYMWNYAATAANGNDAYQRQWDEHDSFSRSNKAFASSSSGTGMRPSVLTPPCPVGNDYPSAGDGAWLPCGSRPDPEFMGCHASYAFDVPTTVNGDSYANAPMEPAQHPSSGAGWEPRRRRVQRDPYKGGILVDSPEVNNDALTVCVSPGSIVNYKPRRVDYRILSPRAFHPSSSVESTDRPKVVSSATDDESPTQLTPYETSSQTQSEADSTGPRQISCGGS